MSADEGCAGIFADNERCGSDTCDYCYRCCEPFRSARLFAYIGNNNRRQSAACIDLFSYVDRLLRIFDIQPDSRLFREHFMVEGFKFLPTELTDSLPVAALLAVVILLAGLIVSFIISDIIFRIRKRPRDRQMLKGTMQA